jgi:hypothetical protein
MTVDALRNLIADLKRTPRGVPKAILVSEYDRRDINQDLLAGSAHQVGKEDQAPEHDGQAIGIIEGIVIASHPHVARGKARLVYPPPAVIANQRAAAPKAEGKIIVGA